MRCDWPVSLEAAIVCSASLPDGIASVDCSRPFDDQNFGNIGNDVRLRSPGYEGATPGYDTKVSSSASMVIITSDPRYRAPHETIGDFSRRMFSIAYRRG